MTDIQAQKFKTNIIDVIQNAGVLLEKHGKEYSACCPFHQEKTPSFFVDEKKQLFHCFGCGAGGDIIDFVTMHNGLTFPQALEYLGIEQQTEKTRHDIRRHQKQREHNKRRDARRNLLKKDFEEWQSWYVRVLVDIVDTFNWLMKNLSWDEIQELSPIVHRMSTWKYHLWLIQRAGNEEAIYELYREQVRKRPN